MDKQNVTKEKGKFNFLKNYLTKKVTMILVIVLALGAGAIGLSKVVSSESKTTKIGFEDIGELATQTAYCTEINVTEASRELGIKQQSISCCCLGKRKTAGGYHWRYVINK